MLSLPRYQGLVAGIMSRFPTLSALQPGEIGELFELDRQIFGALPGVFDLRCLPSIARLTGPNCWVMKNNGAINAYFCAAPITLQMSAQVEHGHAKGLPDFDFELFKIGQAEVHGVFVEAVACRGEGRGAGRFTLVRLSQSFLCGFSTLDFYAVPITEEGMALQQSLGFLPLAEKGLFNVYTKRGGSGASQFIRATPRKAPRSF